MAAYREAAEARATQVKQLLSKKMYYGNENALKLFQDFVADQIQHPELYNVDCNLAILQEYLFFPQTFRLDIVHWVLIKALMHLPTTDFDMCLCQVPMEYQTSDALIRVLIYSERLLQTCRFNEFWALLSNNSELNPVLEIPDFRNSIRRFMANVLSLTYRCIAADEVTKILNIKVEAFEAFCAEHLQGQWSYNAATGMVTISEQRNSSTTHSQGNVSQPLLGIITLPDCLKFLQTIAQS